MSRSKKGLIIPIQIKKDDRVVFLGCSITQARQYTTHVEAELLTRFPHWNLTFRNAGWGSDSTWMDRRAQGTDMNIEKLLQLDGKAQGKVVVRMVAHGLERDVLPLKPTMVLIMYAANDASYGKDMVEPHLRGLQEIVNRLRGANARAILLGFTPQEPLDSAANKNLERYIVADRKFAIREKLPFIDLYHQCTQAILEAQRADSSYHFTSDGVHPTPQGHALMGRVILRGLGIEVEGTTSLEKDPLWRKIVEKNDLYFHRWREIQIPAMLEGKLSSPDTTGKLREIDRKIAESEVAVQHILASSTQSGV